MYRLLFLLTFSGSQPHCFFICSFEFDPCIIIVVLEETIRYLC